MKLDIIRTSLVNDYNATGIASTVTAAEYAVDGKAECRTAGEGEVLVLVVDGAQKDLIGGRSYEVKDSFEIVSTKVYRKAGPSAAPWLNAKDEEKATYYFRQALLVNEGKIEDDYSVKQIITGGRYDDKSADGITLVSGGGHFNGILVDNGSEYTITNSKFYGYGDGGDDLSGWGTLLMADNKSVLNVSDCYIETEGATRCSIYADNTSIANVKNTVIYTKETPDTYEEYQNLVPGMMKRVPFALGMDGTIRSFNVMADGQGIFENCIVVSTSWGTLSTDSGTAYDLCGTYAINAKDTFSGIGTLEIAQEGKEYTAVKEMNGVKYGFTVGGSGYVTYADSGVHNFYDNVEFWSPDFIQIMGSGNTGSDYRNSVLNAGHTAFMSQQTSGGTFTFENTKINTVDSLLQIKSGAANTGFANMVLDSTEVNFSGTSTRDTGILCELVESDDAGNPGILTYTINDHSEEAVATNSSVNDSSFTMKNGSYKGNIYNCIYNYKQNLNVTVENAEYEGTVSSTTYVHVDLEGNLVPNGTVLNAFMGSKEYDHCNYLAEKGGYTQDCKLIGRYKHTAAPVLNNPINVTLKNAKWTVTGDGYLNALAADNLTDITAAAPVTVTVKALTIGGKAYEDGTYNQGNITIVVDSTAIEVIDNGICDAGQTYGNVKYSFVAMTEDGELDSRAVTVKRQNYIDGNVYYKLIPTEGYTILSTEAVSSRIEPNTAGGELEIYEYVLCPENGTTEMGLRIVVSR
ncbi:MAG: hypothetical protein HUJ76_00980 [Parasporobacterium sp.]|nr:hypothetical protein [Parasporobacterium sp.]